MGHRSHLAPEPHALARSGCWMTVNWYDSLLPSFVILVVELTVSWRVAVTLATLATAAIVSSRVAGTPEYSWGCDRSQVGLVTTVE